jgi:hypothetical protein
MRRSRHVALGITTAALLAVSGTPSALARGGATQYTGSTRDGEPISFVLSGSTLSRLTTYVPTLCGTSDGDGTPLSGADPFDPPGTFALGHSTHRTAQRENAMWNTNTVTKNFTVSVRRGPHGAISGRLHVDYSFLMLVYSDPISSRPYVCTGDTTFTATR